MQGTVKFYSSKKGFGFIRSGDEEYFFHISNVTGRVILDKDDPVSFDVQTNERKQKIEAVNVVRLNEAKLCG